MKIGVHGVWRNGKIAAKNSRLNILKRGLEFPNGVKSTRSCKRYLIISKVLLFNVFSLIQDFEASGLPVPNARHHSPGGPLGGSVPGASGGKSRAMDASYSNFPGRGSTSYNKLKKAVSNRLFSQVRLMLKLIRHFALKLGLLLEF